MEATNDAEPVRAARAGRYVRAPRVLWRAGPDRVLVRRIGEEALELTGMAAFVWLALTEPRDLNELASELAVVAGVCAPNGATRARHLDDELRQTLHAALERLALDDVISVQQ